MKKLLVLAGVTVAGSALAADFFEAEANDTKGAANVVAGLVAGDNIRGFTTGASTTVAGIGSADYFRVSTAAAGLGIYQHRLALTSAVAGHVGTIRGLNQIASPADTLAGIPWDGVVGTAGTTDNTNQTSSTATTIPRMNQWYGFGKSESLYYRVAGVAATTAEYFATYSMTAVTPTFLGSFAGPGMITMNWNGQGHTIDTDMAIYDSGLNAMLGYSNDDSSAPLGGAPIATTSLQSWLARSYAPGLYYIAVSNFALTNNQTSASDDNFRTGALMDFGDSILNSSSTTALNLAFTISDGVTSLAVANTKLAAYDVNWFSFEVVPEPGTFVALGAGLAVLAARRRRK